MLYDVIILYSLCYNRCTIFTAESCWTKVPYASLFALLILLAGFGLFTVPFYMGLDELEIFLRKDDGFNLDKESEILWWVKFELF